MAVYILIEKIECDSSSAVYLFSLVDGRSGKFKIDLVTGKTVLIEPILNDDGSLFARAAFKIKKSWEKNKSNLPDKTCWAS